MRAAWWRFAGAGRAGRAVGPPNEEVVFVGHAVRTKVVFSPPIISTAPVLVSGVISVSAVADKRRAGSHLHAVCICEAVYVEWIDEAAPSTLNGDEKWQCEGEPPRDCLSVCLSSPSSARPLPPRSLPAGRRGSWLPHPPLLPSPHHQRSLTLKPHPATAPSGTTHSEPSHD